MAGQSTNQISLRRLVGASLVVCVAFSLLAVRLWYLQCINGSYYRDLSENNRTRTIRTVAPRGTIYDRENRILVNNRPAYNVELMLEDTPDVDSTLSRLGALTGDDPVSLKRSVFQRKTRRHFEPKIVLEDVDRAELARIKVNSYRLPGLIINPIPSRSYPYQSLGAQLFGYSREITRAQLDSLPGSRYVSGDVVGQSGLEKALEPLLQGYNGFIRVEVDAMGNRRGELGIADDRPGKDLYLTLDLDLQRAAEAALGGRRGAVVALDPNTGEILALASAPSFDANLFSGKMRSDEWSRLREDKSKPLTNRAISSTYSPGSTFKLFMAAAALARGKITPNTELNCPGYYFFAGRAYKCHKHSGHGSVNLKKAITVSCNAYFYQVGQMLGIDTIHKIATAFGLGELTGIDLPGEEHGLIPSAEWKRKIRHEKWYEGETLSVAIGQGYVAVTPIQMAVAVSALANGGKVFKPMLVKSVKDPITGESQDYSPQELREVDVDAKSLATVRQIAVEVVNSKDGTGRRAALPGITVAGKTGTAQVKALGVSGKGEKFEDHAWFISFAPYENPMIAVVTIVENAGHGGVAAAPVSKQVMEVFFKKKGMLVVPEEEKKAEVKSNEGSLYGSEEPSEGTLDEPEPLDEAVPAAPEAALHGIPSVQVN